MTWSSQVGTLTGPQLENYSTLTLVPRTQVSSEARGDLVRKSRAGLLLLWFPAGEITGHFHQSISLQQHIPDLNMLLLRGRMSIPHYLPLTFYNHNNLPGEQQPAVLTSNPQDWSGEVVVAQQARLKMTRSDIKMLIRVIEPYKLCKIYNMQD